MNNQISGRSIQPQPLFPKLEHQVNKQSNPDAVRRFIVECAVNFTKCMQSSPYYIKPQSTEIQIERYSDKFKPERIDSVDFEPSWDRLPAELSLNIRNSSKEAHKRKMNGSIVWNDKNEKHEQSGKGENTDEEDANEEVDSEDDDQGDYGVNYYEEDENQDEENPSYD